MKRLLIVLIVSSALVLQGCSICGCGPSRQKKPVVAKTPRVETPAMECGPYAVSRTHPCSTCGIVKLDKNMPKEVQLNRPFDYTIKVTNLTDGMVTDVVVTEIIPDNFKFTNADPTAVKDSNKLIWRLGSLQPGKSTQIKVTGQVTDAVCVQNCATVTYVVPACAYAKVVQPKLLLTKTAPAEVLLCDPIAVKFTVSNNGSGPTDNVRIEDTLPAGLQTSDGKGTVTFSAGTLTPGQSKEFSTTLRASRTGEYINRAVASASGGLKSEATTKTVVRQPVLAITKTGPGVLYIGRSVSYNVTVTNRGDAPAVNTVIEDIIPSGVESIRPSTGGAVSGSKVTWNVGTIPVNGSYKATISYTPTRADMLANTATASAKCANAVTASAKTLVKGIPAVLLEVIDLVDPVEVGSQTTYVITATNQGSTAHTNITIVCTLEENEQYVSSSGPTRGTADGQAVTFAPLPSLAPGAKATWQVVIKAVRAGDVRFRVRMNTGEFERPVEETEATNLYGNSEPVLPKLSTDGQMVMPKGLGGAYKSQEDYGRPTELSNEVPPSAENNVGTADTDSAAAMEAAYAHLKMGRFQSAREMLKSLITREPANGRAHQYLGYCNLKLADVDSAIANYAKAVDLNDADWEAHSGLGVAYMFKARSAGDSVLARKAVEQWQKSLDIKPDQAKGGTLAKMIERYSQ